MHSQTAFFLVGVPHQQEKKQSGYARLLVQRVWHRQSAVVLHVIPLHPKIPYFTLPTTSPPPSFLFLPITQIQTHVLTVVYLVSFASGQSGTLLSPYPARGTPTGNVARIIRVSDLYIKQHTTIP